MPFPDEPCAACPRVARGLPMPCRAMTSKHGRLCELAANGHEGYIDLLCGADARPPRPFPPIAEQAANLAGAAARFVSSGLATTSAEERSRRLAICHGCEQFADGRCRLCGCFLHAKVISSAEHCPLDPPKW